MRETAEKKRDKRGDLPRIPLRCGFVMEDGRKCKLRPWLGKEFCFQHDPETAELRKLAGRPSNRAAKSAHEVQELLGEMLEELRKGRMKPGQAYAAGYLAQLMLTAQESRRREIKLDVKWFWDMVDLLLALEDGQKSLEEKKEKEAKESGQPRMNPSSSLRAGTDERRSEEEVKDEDDSEENGVIS